MGEMQSGLCFAAWREAIVGGMRMERVAMFVLRSCDSIACEWFVWVWWLLESCRSEVMT